MRLSARARIWTGAALALLVVGALALLSGGRGSAPGGSGSPVGGGRAATVTGSGSARAPATSRARARTTTAASRRASSGPAAAGRFARYARRRRGDPLALGRVNAPVVMIEWADFQCPFCGHFARDEQPTLIRRYVDTGRLRIEWRDFPYMGPQSTAAAIAARAAGMQHRFWAYHNALYAHQHPVDSGALTTSYLIALARRLGLNVARFEQDLSDPALARRVAVDKQQGLDLGITGTPAFIVGNTPIMGAQPLPIFTRVINRALAHARR